MELRVNGEPRQISNTSRMSVTVPEIISHYSAMGFSAGDILSTGTVAGVAGFSDDAASLYLKPGDVVEAEIEGVGVLRNPVISLGRGPPGAGRTRRNPQPRAERGGGVRPPPAASAAARAGEAFDFRGIPYAAAARLPRRPAGGPGRSSRRPRRGRRRRSRAGRWPSSPTASRRHREECLNLNVFTPSLAASGRCSSGCTAAALRSVTRAPASTTARGSPRSRRRGRDAQLPARQPRLAGAPRLAPATARRPPTGGCSTSSPRWSGCATTSPRSAATPRVTLAGQSAGALCAIDLLVPRRPPGCSSAPSSNPRRSATWPSRRRGAAAGPRRSARRRWAEHFDAQRLRGLPPHDRRSARTLLEQPEFRGTRGGALPTLDPGAAASPADVPGAGPGRRADRQHRAGGHLLLRLAVAAGASP